jgi:proteasome lid subunit RPN8/RPN11
MIAQAKAELPYECCGLLAGLSAETASPAPSLFAEPQRHVRSVLQRYPLVNNAVSATEYLANDQTLFAAYRDMHEHGLDLLAVYHSHPTSDPVPSKKDLERNYFDNVMHLIISLKTDEPLMRGWWLAEKDFRQAEWEAEN